MNTSILKSNSVLNRESDIIPFTMKIPRSVAGLVGLIVKVYCRELKVTKVGICKIYTLISFFS